MNVKFSKMHGAGNDFIIVDEWGGEAVPERQKGSFVRKACERHFGVGSDGLIFVQRSKGCDVRFGFYNPDGSQAEMCGNGIRCLAKYAYERGIVKKHAMSVETLAGVKVIELTIVEGSVIASKVDMGRPQLRRGQAQVAGKPDETFIAQKVSIAGSEFIITSVGMGNPHAVVFVRDVDEADVGRDGAAIRNHRELFPNGTNAHFVQGAGDNEFKIRTFERGVEGETLACGTGICACAVAAVLNRRARMDAPILFHAKGGDMRVELEGTPDDIRTAYLIGPAEESFRGEISV